MIAEQAKVHRYSVTYKSYVTYVNAANEDEALVAARVKMQRVNHLNGDDLETGFSTDSAFRKHAIALKSLRG